MTAPSAGRRRYRITFRVTADERRALEAKADRAGNTLSEFARMTLVRAKTRARRRPAVEAVLLARILAKLGAIALHLGEIAAAARDANRALALLPAIERDLAQNLRALGASRAMLLQALGKRAR